LGVVPKAVETIRNFFRLIECSSITAPYIPEVGNSCNIKLSYAYHALHEVPSCEVVENPSYYKV
jgi:hypothetical protein